MGHETSKGRQFEFLWIGIVLLPNRVIEVPVVIARR